MNPSVREELDILIRLQETETRASELRVTIQDVEQQQSRLEEVLDRERSVLDEKSEVLASLRKQYRGFEDDLRYNEERLKKSEQTLRTVTNNRDYQVLLREMDDNRKTNGRMQETMVSLIDQISAMEAELTDIQARVDAEARRVEEQKAELMASCSREVAALAKLEEEHRTLGQKASLRLLKRFEKAVSLGGGVGVACVSGSICKGCFMTLPPQFCIELQRCNEIRHCPRCNRIVYWNGA
ncbi:putative nucleic acid-binding Zn-ribbon protein [Desulfobotulus alkaliphilus]|uniref:Putative nucleic acid-binding Zn-ribbon protein n=1 Tax=Desulfobotulus alkaliphilus TaxID=622671 RepID=A0A562RKH5_9BACT|nr:C4-type zinc ribbon domain-containing protein [Desulfobotulus alkaliphilus]TWI68936.1 putative nucleic acid-binding Zn-ribbon protein [Desulfobotulus alkaliphilus]